MARRAWWATPERARLAGRGARGPGDLLCLDLPDRRRVLGATEPLRRAMTVAERRLVPYRRRARSTDDLDSPRHVARASLPAPMLYIPVTLAPAIKSLSGLAIPRPPVPGGVALPPGAFAGHDGEVFA